MTYWIVAGATAAGTLAVVLTAIVRDPSPGRPRAGVTWDVPSGEELRRATFPTAWPGYDRAHVDAWLAAVADAWDALVEEAGPGAVERARERLGGRDPAARSGAGGRGSPSDEELEDRGGDRTRVLDR